MRFVDRVTGVCAVLLIGAAGPVAAQEPEPKNIPIYWVCQLDKPSVCRRVGDIIPDAATALTVGMAVLRAHYGADALRRYLPYKAGLSGPENDQWCITRKLPKGLIGRKGGGHPDVCLSKRDGRVLRFFISA
jgi:hypothetical protein